jgi:hypothetical protein
MDPQNIIATARSGNVPYNWNVWPLRRDRVRRSMLGWSALSLLGFALLIPSAISTIPDNFEASALRAVVTLLILLLFAVLAVGGLVITLVDGWRLAHAGEYLLIMTPDDFVKVTPRGIIHVPMEHIAHITLRGVKTPQERFAEERARATVSDRLANLIGAGTSRRDARSAPSLAFIDTRTNREVVVATDNSFEELIVLEHILSDHVFAKERRQLA